MNSADHTTRASRSNRRPGLILAGVVAAVIGVAALVGGALLVNVHATNRDGDGFYSTKPHALSTPTRALLSDGLDVGEGDGDWFFRKGRLATIRVTATGTQSTPIFVGIARSAQISSYLREVAHDEITDFEVEPFSVERVRHAGSSAPTPPAREQFWAAKASGSGPQSVRWSVRDGSWRVVVMNANGSPRVATHVSLGAKVPLILWLGVALLAVGAVLFLAGGSAICRGARGRRRAASSRIAPAQAAGRGS